MAMLYIVRSWIVHLTLFPCCLLHFCPNLARLPHYVYLVLMASLWQDRLFCPPAFKPSAFFPLGVWLGWKLHHKWKEKNYSNEWLNEKPQKCMCMPNVLACLSKPERTYWSLKSQLDTVIIEDSSVKVLSLRGNPWRLYRAKQLPSWNRTYSDTGFYSAQTTYLSVKVLTFENIRFFLTMQC